MVAHQHDGLVVRRQFRCQRICYTALITCENPYSCRLLHLRRSLRQYHTSVRCAGRVRLPPSQYLHFTETRIAERLSPDCGAGQCVVRTVVVGKAPPAVQLPESQILPALTAKVLKRHQLARWRE